LTPHKCLLLRRVCPGDIASLDESIGDANIGLVERFVECLAVLRCSLVGCVDTLGSEGSGGEAGNHQGGNPASKELQQQQILDSVIVSVVASKVDASAEEQVSILEASEFVTKVQGKLHQTSSKTGEGIAELFKSIAERLLQKELSENKQP